MSEQDKVLEKVDESGPGQKQVMEKEQMDEWVGEWVSEQEQVALYIKSLNEMDIQALEIAKEYLESSFNIVKSIGYQKWLKK